MSDPAAEVLPSKTPDPGLVHVVHSRGHLTSIPIECIQTNPAFEVRGHVDVASLTMSIRDQGQLAPLVARPIDNGSRVELIAGHRRLAALKRSGAKVALVHLQNMSDKEAVLVSLAENRERQDLNPMEEAKAIHQAIAKFGYTPRELAGALGQSEPWVSNRLRLLKLHPKVQDLIQEGKVSAGHAEHALLRLEPGDQLNLAKDIAREGLSVKRAAQSAGHRLELRAEEKQFREQLKTAKYPKCPRCKGDAQEFAGDGERFHCEKWHTWDPETGKDPHAHLGGASSSYAGGTITSSHRPGPPPSLEPMELRVPLTPEQWTAALFRWILEKKPRVEYLQVMDKYGDKEWNISIDLKGPLPFKTGRIKPETFDTGEKSQVYFHFGDGPQRVRQREEYEAFLRWAKVKLPPGGLLGVPTMGVRCPRCQHHQRLPKRAQGSCGKCGAPVKAETQRQSRSKGKKAKAPAKKPAKKGVG